MRRPCKKRYRVWVAESHSESPLKNGVAVLCLLACCSGFSSAIPICLTKESLSRTNRLSSSSRWSLATQSWQPSSKKPLIKQRIAMEVQRWASSTGVAPLPYSSNASYGERGIFQWIMPSSGAISLCHNITPLSRWNLVSLVIASRVREASWLCVWFQLSVGSHLQVMSVEGCSCRRPAAQRGRAEG